MCVIVFFLPAHKHLLSITDCRTRQNYIKAHDQMRTNAVSNYQHIKTPQTILQSNWSSWWLHIPTWGDTNFCTTIHQTCTKL